MAAIESGDVTVGPGWVLAEVRAGLVGYLDRGFSGNSEIRSHLGELQAKVLSVLEVAFIAFSVVASLGLQHGAPDYVLASIAAVGGGMLRFSITGVRRRGDG